MVGNAVWAVHGVAVYGVAAAADSHLPASHVVSHTCTEQAGRQAVQTTGKPTEGRTGCMGIIVCYTRMCRLSDQSQHDGTNGALGNTDTHAQEAGVYVRLASQVCLVHFAADVAALRTSASIVRTISFQVMWVWSRSSN